MKKLLLLILFTSTNIWAMPEHFEVWFLSVDKVSYFDQILKPEIKSYLTAQTNLQCQQMGEYCFDPQVGLYKKNDAMKVAEEVDLSKIENNKKYDFLEPASALDRNMIECDKSQFFDIFCGKSQKKVKEGKADLEIWIDTSSTMKQVDFEGFDNECKRERFLKDLNATCPMNQKMKVYYFEEMRKEAGSFDRVCLSGGLNNMKRIISDIELSKAKNIIIITDIYEAEEKFIDAIELTGRGVIKGLKTPLYAKDLKTELKRIRSFCK